MTRALLFVTLAACFTPEYPVGLLCTTGGECPPGQACTLGRCGLEPGTDGGLDDGPAVTSCPGGTLLPAEGEITLTGDTTGKAPWNRPGAFREPLTGALFETNDCPADALSGRGTSVPYEAHRFCAPAAGLRYDVVVRGRAEQAALSHPDPFTVVYSGAEVPSDRRACLRATSATTLSDLAAPGSFVVVVSGADNNDVGTYELVVRSTGVKVGFTQPTSLVGEEIGSTSIEVSLDAPAMVPVAVDYLVDGVAGGTLTFTPPAVTATITLPIASDTVPEPSQRIVLELTNPVGAVVTSGSHTVTVWDDDTPCTQTPGDGVITEIDDTTIGGDDWLRPNPTTTCPATTATTTEIRFKPHVFCNRTAAPATLRFHLEGTDEVPALTLANPYLIAYADSEIPFDPLRCLAANDDALGTSAGAALEATLAPGASVVVVATGAASTNQGTYRLRVAERSFAFAMASETIAENVGTHNVQVNLNSASTQSPQISYRVFGGTAVAGEDYTLAAGTLIFGPGQTSKTIPVAITNDLLREGNQTLILELHDPQKALLVPGRTTLTITDDEPPPTVQLASASSSATEGGAPFTIAITLSAPSQEIITVSYGLSGNATQGAGQDYTIAPSSPVSFAAGETSKSVTITLGDDAVPEGTETIVVTLTSPSGAVLGATVVHTVSLADNE